jgi:hypothetical protein
MKCLNCPKEAEPNSNYCANHKAEYPRKIYKILYDLWTRPPRAITLAFAALASVGLLLSVYTWRQKSTIPNIPMYPRSAKIGIFNNRKSLDLDNMRVLTSQCLSSNDKARGAAIYVIDLPQNGNYLLELAIDRPENRHASEVITIVWNDHLVGRVDPLERSFERAFDAGYMRSVAEVVVKSGNNKLELLTEGKTTICDITLTQEYRSKLSTIDEVHMFDAVHATFDFRGSADGRLIIDGQILNQRYLLDVGEGFKRRIRIIGEAHYLSQNRNVYEFIFE